MITKTKSRQPVSTGLPYAETDPHRLAGRYVKVHGRDSHGHAAIRYWRDEFWRYRDGRYVKVTDSELRAEISTFIRNEFRARRAVNRNGTLLQVTRGIVSNVMQAMAGDLLVPSQTEQPVWLRKQTAGPFFAFLNGLHSIGELIGGQSTGLQPHCSSWFSQTAFPFAYDAAAQCPRWTSFLDEVLEGDTERIALSQQWFGYCLVPDTTQQRFIVAVGDGAVGKSTTLDTLTNLLGPDNVSHVRAELFAQRFQLTMTLGKLANVSYDTGEIDESAEATIKEFTAGDRMYFDRKGVPGVMARPTARLILATNHEPRFADRSKGIWRRMILIPFRVGIPTERQDKKLVEKLKAELPGIFNWSIEGLRALRHQGSFTVPAISQHVWTELKAQSNYTHQFLMETCDPADAGQSVSCTALYARYEEWCRDRGFKVLDDTQFGKELRKAFPNVDRQRETTGERPWRYARLRITGHNNHMTTEEVTRG